MTQIWHTAILVVRFPRRWPAKFHHSSSSVEGSDIRPSKSTQPFRGAEKLEIFPRIKTAVTGLEDTWQSIRYDIDRVSGSDDRIFWTPGFCDNPRRQNSTRDAKLLT